MEDFISRDAASTLITETVARLIADREHGASWLSREAARLLARLTASVPVGQAQARLTLTHVAAIQLAQARPSMAALANTAARIWSAGDELQAGDAAALASEQAQRMHTAAAAILTQWETSAERIADAARPLVGEVVFTLSRSGTVEAALTRLGGEKRVQQVFVAESRPGGEGIATSRALAAAGLAVSLAPDAAVGAFIGEASAVVLGADSVRANGDVVNKVGSYPLALVARETRVPVYVLAETLKIAAPDFPLQLEPLEWPEAPRPPAPGIELRSVGFEVVPARLITAVVSEAGVLDRAQIAVRAEAAGRALAALMSWASPGG